MQCQTQFLTFFKAKKSLLIKKATIEFGCRFFCFFIDMF
ncbi:hypothetical protein LRU_01164 [Ligilactobacillus ruminis SPM0211]|uniref:Uncharacterized protein n=1 Tax=Ligilactobacillus ruminis SPM0211 TaxID=1040964 RepID=F7R0S4_9LACO|nr:hypothetical protein LRU_01164 [Ligilactobacillus ruminis SPM0211]